MKKHPTLWPDEGPEPSCWHGWYKFGVPAAVMEETRGQENFFAPQPPSLDHTPLCFVDVETTGLHKEDDRIIQLAITRVEPNGEVSTYLNYYNVGTRPNAAWRINNLDTRKIAKAGYPNFGVEAYKVSRMLEGALLVAHNGKACDEPFLRKALERCGLSWPCVGLIDTLPLARSIWTDTKHGLGVLASYLGVEQGKEHDAQGDVQTLMGIWWAIRKERPKLTLSELVKMKAAVLVGAL